MKQWIDRALDTVMRDEPVDLPKPIPPTIHGWMWEWELRYLYSTAKHLAESGIEGDLLEVGSYKGLSASALGQAGNLTCVDTFQGGEDLRPYDSRPDFDAAMKTMDLSPEVIAGRSQDVLPTLLGRKFRLVFIDGSHEYENVKVDIFNAWKFLSPGGVLVLDDVHGFPGVIDFPGVLRAAQESGHVFHLCSPQFSKMAVSLKER